MLDRVKVNGSAMLLALLWVAGAAPGLAAEKPPRYQFDQKFDFSRLHTFDLNVDPSKQTEGAIVGTVLPKFLALIEELLVAKGFTRSQDRPDFVVTFDTMVVDDWSSISYSGHGEVAKGVLVLRAAEPAQAEPFWMGADTAGLTGRITPEKAWKKVDRASRRILAGFPPPR